MHRALPSWELLGLVCCASYTRLKNPAVPTSAALTQAGISTAAQGGKVVGVDQPGEPQCVHEPHCLNQLHLGPMLSCSAPYAFLSSVGAVPVPQHCPAAGSLGALQTHVVVPCCCLVSWMNPAVPVQVAWYLVLPPDWTLELCCR